MDQDAEPIVVEQTFNVPIADVWKAITDQDQMREWYFEAMKEFEPKVGFETEFDVLCEGTTYPHLWKVTDVVWENKIAYDWHYRGFPGMSSATWELTEADGKTKLKLTHAVTETFPQDNPIFSRESGVEGWNYLIHDSLKAFLDDQQN